VSNVQTPQFGCNEIEAYLGIYGDDPRRGSPDAANDGIYGDYFFNFPACFWSFLAVLVAARAMIFGGQNGSTCQEIVDKF
jgi:hypothetical protein